ELVDAVVRNVQPDVLQFHGHETGAFCRSFNRPYIKAIAMGGEGAPLPNTTEYADAAALMFDSHAPGALGGSGERFDWQRAEEIPSQRLIVAGGLDADNVGQAIAALHPHAVDVSSGIERSPGIKDSGKMAAFVAAVRRADAGAAAADTN
ncbi:MAG: phosphoribosylanthranilate isomerase, partial [Sinobacteraceae bacterium]|nr:phosphoribosylanthranilate isomerase [Nevskiaceae bacterium]